MAMFKFANCKRLPEGIIHYIPYKSLETPMVFPINPSLPGRVPVDPDLEPLVGDHMALRFVSPLCKGPALLPILGPSVRLTVWRFNSQKKIRRHRDKHAKSRIVLL